MTEPEQNLTSQPSVNNTSPATSEAQQSSGTSQTQIQSETNIDSKTAVDEHLPSQPAENQTITNLETSTLNIEPENHEQPSDTQGLPAESSPDSKPASLSQTETQILEDQPAQTTQNNNSAQSKTDSSISAPAKTPSTAEMAPAQTSAGIKSFLTKALEAIRFRKKAKIEKIMNFAKQRGSITNDQTEKLLRVSDSTASRYLNSLVAGGRLRVVGEGKMRRYEPL